MPVLRAEGVESLAIGFLHAYANAEHEERAAQILRAELGDSVPISLSSQVCPEVREYERFSTTVANAYVQPLMKGYLGRLAEQLASLGVKAPLMLMTSGGGVTTLDTAMRFPIRLVESGPAGGAVLAAEVAREFGLQQAISLDVGGTTAKICLLEHGQPMSARTFEVDRAARFTKGSGLPIRIPVIEMVEIGAGGGSIASVDSLNRIAVGPRSAGADPGPACYAAGGEAPTVTDADLVLGRLQAEGFAAGRLQLRPELAEKALGEKIGLPLGLEAGVAAWGVTEMVDETMANAVRVHAAEHGQTASEHTLIAFGGAAPLHAVRVASKLGIQRVIIPVGAGVGSAIGFLRAPFAYELVHSRQEKLAELELPQVNALLKQMHTEASAVVAMGAADAEQEVKCGAYMRYLGQGHEIYVALPPAMVSGDVTLGDGAQESLHDAFQQAYAALYGRAIPGAEAEVLTWVLAVCTVSTESAPAAQVESQPQPQSPGQTTS